MNDNSVLQTAWMNRKQRRLHVSEEFRGDNDIVYHIARKFGGDLNLAI